MRARDLPFSTWPSFWLHSKRRTDQDAISLLKRPVKHAAAAAGTALHSPAAADLSHLQLFLHLHTLSHASEMVAQAHLVKGT